MKQPWRVADPCRSLTNAWAPPSPAEIHSVGRNNALQNGASQESIQTSTAHCAKCGVDSRFFQPGQAKTGESSQCPSVPKAQFPPTNSRGALLTVLVHANYPRRSVVPI
jgi:hypothetical protein